MGASQSAASGPLTHEKLFELTKDTRTMMDKLLEYTTQKIAISDFLQLSSPDGCKKYVMFLTNRLHQFFYELQVAPGTDKRGVIFFRSIKDLAAPSKEEDVERQSLCLTIAYFYTRIFQIYGALALTLIDDVSYISQSGVMELTERAALRAPGYHPTTYHGGAEFPLGMPPAYIGGAEFTLRNMGNFRFLKGFLMDQTYGDKGYRTRYVGDDNSRGAVYFNANVDREDLSIEQEGVFYIAYTNAKDFVKLSVTAKEVGIGSSNLSVTFGRIRYFRNGELEEKEMSMPSSIKRTITLVGKPINGSMTYTIEGSSTSLNDYLLRMFAVLIPYVKSILTTKETQGVVSADSVAEPLMIRRVLENLKRVKPLGHCIARGLQLLRNAPFQDDPNMSYICKPKFLETARGAQDGIRLSRSGIPAPGERLKDSPGISALAQLFYDTILLGNNQIQIGTAPGPSGKSTKQQYLEFITVMARLFGDQEMMAKDAETKVRNGVEQIKDRRDRDLCAMLSPTDRENLGISSPVAKEVYQYVGQLFQRQLRHATECGKIFQQLFNVKRDPQTGAVQIALSTNIIQGGFPEINRINHDAREVLMNYYKDCETTYLHGMKTVIDSKIKERNPVVNRPANSKGTFTVVPIAPNASKTIPIAPSRKGVPMVIPKPF